MTAHIAYSLQVHLNKEWSSLKLTQVHFTPLCYLSNRPKLHHLTGVALQSYLVISGVSQTLMLKAAYISYTWLLTSPAWMFNILLLHPPELNATRWWTPVCAARDCLKTSPAVILHWHCWSVSLPFCFRKKYCNNYRMHCLEILHRHLLS